MYGHALRVFVATEVRACPGDTVTLPCYSTRSRGVDWRYRKSSGADGSYVVASDHVQKNYEDRFNLNRTTTCQIQHSLVISRVRLDDQGVYVCIEDSGLGPRHQYQLTVHGQSSVYNRLQVEFIGRVKWRTMNK